LQAQAPPPVPALNKYWEKAPFNDVLADVDTPPAEPSNASVKYAEPASANSTKAAGTSSRRWLVTAVIASAGLSAVVTLGVVVMLLRPGRTAPPRPAPVVELPTMANMNPVPEAAPALPAPVAQKAPIPEPRQPVPQHTISPPKPIETPAFSFANWLQEFEVAQQKAKEQKKDILILFDWSDSGGACERLAIEVFANPVLGKQLTDRFVPVHIDFPTYPSATRRVENPQRNEMLQRRFFRNPQYPRVVLTDVSGLPYAYQEAYKVSSQEYVAQIDNCRRVREDRDELLAAVAKASGLAKLAAAEAALKFLSERIEAPTSRDDGTYVLSLVEFYAPLLKEWRTLAETLDPKNEAGYCERFFKADWDRRRRNTMADPGASSAAENALAEEFDAWRSKCHLKDNKLAVDLWGALIELRSHFGDDPEKEFRAILKLKPLPAKELVERAQQGLADMRVRGVGRRAPPITGKDLDGKSFKLSDYRGKVVLLDFWGFW
jgi:hypothetical protein